MTIDLTLYSNNPADDFDMLKFLIEKDRAIVSFKSFEETEDVILNIDVADLKKLAKIINDINL